jgi:hypothetical protein
MKSSELRIGNLVRINNDLLPETRRETCSVYGVNERFDNEFPDSTGVISLRNIRNTRTYSQFDEFIEPIPLTEEWLLKFGFKDRYDYWKKGGVKMVWSSRIVRTGERLGIRHKKCDHIVYVHQLQNLYFALTGEELIITE